MIYANNKPIRVTTRGKYGAMRNMAVEERMLPALTVWAWCGK